jgi:hypothetical protein
MKKLVVLFALFALFSCSEESIEPIEHLVYDINGVWKGNGDFVISQFPKPGEMDIEIIIISEILWQFSYNLLLDGVYFEEKYHDGTLSRTGNKIDIEIFKTSKDGTNRVLLLTFIGTITGDTISGTLLFVRGGDSGDFKLRK